MSEAESKSDNVGVVEIRVCRTDAGLRLDQLLVNRFPEHSRTFSQRCIKAGNILLNGQSCSQAYAVKTNDLICVEWPEEPTMTLEAEDLGLDILSEDDDVIVLNKPPGLVVHPAKGNMTGTLVHGLLFHDKQRFGALLDEEMRPGIVHRLDKDTSGVMVVAKNEKARVAMKRAFAERRVEKHYLAIVVGEFGVVTGRIETQMGRHPVFRKKMAVLSEGGKHAITNYRVLASTGDVTLVLVRIETGRTHQIRRHFVHLRHPIIGDTSYGDGRHNQMFREKFNSNRLMLAAVKLELVHPFTQKELKIEAPLEAEFKSLLKKLGI